VIGRCLHGRGCVHHFPGSPPFPLLLLYLDCYCRCHYHCHHWCYCIRHHRRRCRRCHHRLGRMMSCSCQWVPCQVLGRCSCCHIINLMLFLCRQLELDCGVFSAWHSTHNVWGSHRSNSHGTRVAKGGKSQTARACRTDLARSTMGLSRTVQ